MLEKQWPCVEVSSTCIIFICLHVFTMLLTLVGLSVCLILTSVKPFQEEYSVWVSAAQQVFASFPVVVWKEVACVAVQTGLKRCDSADHLADGWLQQTLVIAAYLDGVSPLISGIIASVHYVGHVSTSLIDPQTCSPRCYLFVLPPPLLKKLLRLLKVLLPTPYSLSP